MSRKSQFFNLFLVIGFLFFMVVSYFVLSNKAYSYIQDGFVGENQLELFNKYSDGEKAINYLSDSAVISSQQALYDLGIYGGVSMMFDPYYGFNLWSNESGFFDINTTAGFVELFSSDLNNASSMYQANFKLKNSNYKVKLLNDSIEGIPLAPVSIKIGKGIFYDGKLGYFPVESNYSFINDWGNNRPGGRLHEGTDIMAPKGTKVIASVSGKIENVGCNEWGGNRIGIRDDEGNYFYYAHLDSYGLNQKEGRVLKVGDYVNAGDDIGTVGDTLGCYTNCDYNKQGNSCGVPGKTESHLHFGIYQDRYNGRAVNPYNSLQEFLGNDVETTFGTVGIYSVMPYFSVPFNSSLINYSSYFDSARRISSACSQKQDLNLNDDYSLTGCVASEAALDGLNMSYACIDDSVYSFKEQLENCIRSSDDGCECEISFKGSKIDVVENSSGMFAVKGDISLQIPKISYLYRNIAELILSLDPTVKDSIVVHKSGNNLSEADSVLRECRIDDRFFKVCAKTKTQVITYDGLDNVRVDFAFYVNDSAAPPIINLEIPKSSKDVALLSFKKSPAPDVSHYVVYYSSDIELRNVDDALDDGKKLDVSLTFPAVSIDEMILHTDRLYYNSTSETFYRPMQMPVTEVGGKLYNFAVVAVDKHDNYLKNLSSFSVRLFPSG